MSERKYKLSFGELTDRLSVIQLRELMLPQNKDEYSADIKSIMHDMSEITGDLAMKKIRLMMILAQLNTLIWCYKDIMELRKDKYDEYLKLAHQVNGLKNQIKNALSENGKLTNINTDGLDFFVSIDDEAHDN